MKRMNKDQLSNQIKSKTKHCITVLNKTEHKGTVLKNEQIYNTAHFSATD